MIGILQEEDNEAGKMGMFLSFDSRYTGLQPPH
jgi:hypothetical protein